MLTGYALYLDKRNSQVADKFKAAKEKFGKALFNAIEKNDNTFVNTAFNRNLLNGFEHQGITPFQFAISKDNPDAMDKLMPPNTDKFALVYYIIETGGPKVTKRLLGSVDVNAIPITNGYDPLTASVSFDKKDVAFTLLNGGFKYDNSLALANDISKSLFEKTVSVLSFYAIDKSNAQMLDFVVQQAPAVLKPQVGSKENIIDAIVKDNKTKLLPILVKHGLDVKNKQYAYLLELAINSNAEELGLALIELGIDISHSPADGGSLINLLVTKKTMNNLFDVLLQKGVNLTARNTKNDLAIMTAMQHSDIVKARKLLERNCPMDFWSSQSGNQIHWIVENGISTECIALLAQFKVDVNGKDKSGDSPLMFALKKSAPTYAREVLKVGASVNVANEKNVTPLQFAIYRKSDLLSDMLVKCDNPNVQGINGWTALHFAVREGNVEAVKRLLEANANPMIADNWGRTPYRVAREHGQEEIKKMLRKKMGLPNIVKTAYATNKKTPKV
jgi:ankyrin repeat protein